MNDTPAAPRTAFTATERMLRVRFGDAPLDAASFRRLLRPCSLDRCGGTCCSAGASLNGEEALVIRQLVRRHADFFAVLVPDLPNPPLIRDGGTDRTATRPRAFRAAVPDFPAHFEETACAFLLGDGRCALQCLAEAEGRHPWSFKPLACWLHPISLSPDGIALPDERTDPHAGGFATQTHCGRAEPCGTPAHTVLAAELEFLGELVGRDLRAEIAVAGTR